MLSIFLQLSLSYNYLKGDSTTRFYKQIYGKNIKSWRTIDLLFGNIYCSKSLDLMILFYQWQQRLMPSYGKP